MRFETVFTPHAERNTNKEEHTKQNMDKKRVVIAGAGFAGFHIAQKIQNNNEFSVTLVDKKDAFEFTPLIVETITQNVSAGTVAEPLNTLSKEITIRKEEIKEANLEKKELITTAGTIPYDTLIISIGSTVQYFNTPGAAEHALALRTLDDAKKIREHITECVTKARENDNEREELLTVVIVGAGPTGVEAACEIDDLLHDLRHENPIVQEARIILVDSKPTILAVLDPWLSTTTQKTLLKRKIELKLGAKVVEIQEKVIKLETETIPAYNIIWAAGMKANEITITPAVEKDRMGRIKVDEYLRVLGREDVFALGDIAWFTDQKTNTPLPQTAQIANSQAYYLSNELILQTKGKKPKPFAFKQKGVLVSLGRFNAIGILGGIKIKGIIAWFVWRSAYFSKLSTTAQKLRAAKEWTLNLFGKKAE